MLDASLLTRPSESRYLLPNERLIVAALLDRVDPALADPQALDGAQVSDMHDGRMGSIRFLHGSPRRYKKTLAEAICSDSDGVPVSLALSVDDRGELFELDIWKTDFSPLKHYPDAANLAFQVIQAHHLSRPA